MPHFYKEINGVGGPGGGRIEQKMKRDSWTVATGWWWLLGQEGTGALNGKGKNIKITYIFLKRDVWGDVSLMFTCICDLL